MIRIATLLLAILCGCANAYAIRLSQTSDVVAGLTNCAATFLVVLLVSLDLVMEYRARRLEKEQAENFFRASRGDSFEEPHDVRSWKDAASKLSMSLLEHSQRERLIADYSSDVSFCLNDQLEITAINPAVRKHWMLEPAILPGNRVLNIVHEDYRERTLAALESALSGESVDSFETQVISGHHTIIDSLWNVEYSKTEHLLFVVATDITSRKAVDRMRQQLFSMLGHDLRVPLTTVQFAMSVIENESELGPVAAKALKDAQRSAGRAIKLSSDMLDLQQAEQGLLKLKEQEVALAEVIRECVAEVQSLALTAQRTLQLSVHENVLVCADEDRLKQVLANLLSNAIKYGAPGQILVETVEEPAANIVRVKVHNDGEKITPGNKALLFKEYSRLENSTGQVAGSGLGLALSKMLITAMGGKITVEDSDKLTGPCFTFSLRISELA